MGDVHEGTDTRTHARVAIRIVSETWTRASGAADELLRDVERAGGLAHPSLERLIAAGRTSSGRCYTVTPWLEGDSLDALIDTPYRWDPAEVAALLSPLASALDELHAAGLTHRFVSPSKVRITEDGDGPRLVLTGAGFGALLASACPSARSSAPAPSPTHLEYVAPEHELREAVDGRADVYAVATLAFRLLTGRVPFVDSRTLAGALAARRSPAPSLRAAARMPYPPFIEDALARGLSIDPRKRFVSAGAFVGDLWRGCHREPRLGIEGHLAPIPREVCERAIHLARGELDDGASTEMDATRMAMETVDALDERVDSVFPAEPGATQSPTTAPPDARLTGSPGPSESGITRVPVPDSPPPDLAGLAGLDPTGLVDRAPSEAPVESSGADAWAAASQPMPLVHRVETAPSKPPAGSSSPAPKPDGARPPREPAAPAIRLVPVPEAAPSGLSFTSLTALALLLFLLAGAAAFYFLR